MSKKASEVKNYGMSVKGKLLNISRESGREYNLIVTRYFQERLLYRLSISRYHDSFYLKGGALLYAFDKMSARPTLDIDFLGKDISRETENIASIFAEICAIRFLEDGVVFDPETIEATEIMTGRHYNGVNITVTAHLETIIQNVSMDIGFGDLMVPPPISLDYPLFLEEMPAIQVNAYSRETIVAEKFQTMIEKSVANSRMKDFYDVYTILSEGKVNGGALEEAIIGVFKNRQTKFVENHPLFTEAFATDPLRVRQWESFLKRIKHNGTLPFTVVMATIKEELLPYWESLK
jgi:predicted nucleotidyltransferase component of viral defense system